MESAEAAEKQCGTDKLSEDDRALGRLYKSCGEVYINEKVFTMCLVEIRRYIDLLRLKDHLLKHKVILMEQFHEITNPQHSSNVQVDHLLKCVGCAGGRHGYFLLYVSLYESSSEGHRGHKCVVEELQTKAREMKVCTPENVVHACCVLDREHTIDSSDSGYEESVIYKCNCDQNCTLSDYMNGTGCQKSAKNGFPFLSLPCDSYEGRQLKTALYEQSRAISEDFVDLADDTFQQLRKIDFEKVHGYTNLLVSSRNYDSEVFGHQPDRNCIVEAKTHKDLEIGLMQNFYSWFNFGIIKRLRDKFLFQGCPKNDKVLLSYEDRFSKYCSRRCFESPKLFHPQPVAAKLTSLVFKVDEKFNNYTLLQVDQIRSTVEKVIKSHDHAIYVGSVKDGCVEVSCYLLPQFQLSQLNEDQISQLKDHNIISFKMDDKELLPPCQCHTDCSSGYSCVQAESSIDSDAYDASSEEESDNDNTSGRISEEVVLEASNGFETDVDKSQLEIEQRAQFLRKGETEQSSLDILGPPTIVASVCPSEFSDDLSPSKVADWLNQELEKKGLSLEPSMRDKLTKNRINGAAFKGLSESDLKTMEFQLGLIRNILTIIDGITKVNEDVDSNKAKSPKMTCIMSLNPRLVNEPDASESLCKGGAPAAMPFDGRLWRKEKLTVQIYNPDYLSHWNIKENDFFGCVYRWCGGKTSYIPKFEFEKSDDPDIIVYFNDQGWNQSTIGHDKKEYPSNLYLDLSDDDQAYREHLIVHEFGHALGLGHEHQRSDFWKYIKRYVNKDLMKSELGGRFVDWEVDCNVMDGGASQRYDPDSVMHYWFDKDWLTDGYSNEEKIDEYVDTLLPQVISALRSVHKRQKCHVTFPSYEDLRFLNEKYESIRLPSIDKPDGVVDQEKTSEKQVVKSGPIEGSDVLFKDLAENIGIKYKEVGVDLGLSTTRMNNEVDTVLLMLDPVSRRAMKMLQLWKASATKREFTYAKLAAALVKNGLKESAEMYCYI